VLRIRIGFSVDPDSGSGSSFLPQMRIRIQGAQPIRIHADLDPGRTLASKKLDFDMKNILYVGNVINLPFLRRYKSHFERLESGYLLISLLLNPDPHSQYGSPGDPTQCGSGSVSKTLLNG
jgi:hypothetical protein